MKQMIAPWSMVMVHGLMVAVPSLAPVLSQIVRLAEWPSRVEIMVNKFYVVALRPVIWPVR